MPLAAATQEAVPVRRSAHRISVKSREWVSLDYSSSFLVKWQFATILSYHICGNLSRKTMLPDEIVFFPQKCGRS